jgi:hypothetical protein
MTIHGSSRGRGRVCLILLAMLGTALVSMLALPRWDSSARADGQQKGSEQHSKQKGDGTCRRAGHYYLKILLASLKRKL